jgi:hypothetical protein
VDRIPQSLTANSARRIRVLGCHGGWLRTGPGCGGPKRGRVPEQTNPRPLRLPLGRSACEPLTATLKAGRGECKGRCTLLRLQEASPIPTAPLKRW